jgi:hypothetical protein
VSVNGAQEYCHLHDPARSEERRRLASRAGRARGTREVAILKEEIKTVIADVKAGDRDRNDAAVMIQGYRALKDFIALERQIKETEDLEVRIEKLEFHAQAKPREQRGGASRWQQRH